MVQIWQLKFNPLSTIQLSWNFAGLRSLDDNTIFKKKINLERVKKLLSRQ